MKNQSNVNNPASIVSSSSLPITSRRLNFDRPLLPGAARRSLRALSRLLGLALLLATLASISAQAQNAYVANEGSNSVSVIDTSKNIVVAVVPVGIFPQSAAVTPDGAHAYVANLLSDSVSVIDTSKNAVSATVQLPVGSYPAAVTISPNGATAYVANYGTNSVSVISVPGNNLGVPVSVAPVGTLAGPWGLGLTPDGSRLYVTDIDSSQVPVIDTSKKTVIATIQLPAGSLPSAVAVTPNGARAYVTGSGTGTVFVIDTSTNSVVKNITDPSLLGPYGVAIAPDGKHVYVSDSASTVVSVIDPTANTVVTKIGNLSAPLGESITPDGTKLFVANYMSSGTVSVVDTSLNSVVVPVTVGSYPRGVGVKTGGSACGTCGTFPFASFSVNLEVKRSGFNLNGTFSPAAGSGTEIDPVTQPVTLQVGDFSATIAKGSFKRNPRGKFIFEGVLNGVSLEVQIAAVGINEGGLNYAFHVNARPVSLAGVPGTVTVQLQIGNNTGKTTVSVGYGGVAAATAPAHGGKERHGDRDKDSEHDNP